MAILILLQECEQGHLSLVELCTRLRRPFFNDPLINFGQSYLSFLFFESSIFTQEKKSFLGHQIHPMTCETLGDLVEGFLDLALD